jgi:hypothetical protein
MIDERIKKHCLTKTIKDIEYNLGAVHIILNDNTVLVAEGYNRDVVLDVKIRKVTLEDIE